VQGITRFLARDRRVRVWAVFPCRGSCLAYIREASRVAYSLVGHAHVIPEVARLRGAPCNVYCGGGTMSWECQMAKTEWAARRACGSQPSRQFPLACGSYWWLRRWESNQQPFKACVWNHLATRTLLTWVYAYTHTHTVGNGNNWCELWHPPPPARSNSTLQRWSTTPTPIWTTRPSFSILRYDLSAMNARVLLMLCSHEKS
jgi:hypothetical protein